MLQSIIVYTLMCLSLSLLTRTKTIINNNGSIKIISPKFYFIGIIVSLFIFAFFSGVRWDVGIDHLTYLDTYQKYNITNTVLREDMEKGYVYLIKLFNQFGAHFSIFFGTIAFVQMSMVFLCFRKAKYIIPYLGIFLICGGDFFSWMNGIRQAIVATCFLFLAAECILKRRFLIYLICIYLLAFIHKSAYFLIPFYAIAYLPLEKFYIKRYIQYILFFSALLLSTTNIWIKSLDLVENLLTIIGYDERFNIDSIEQNIRSQNFGARKMIFLIIDIIIISYSNVLRKTFPDKLFGFSYILFILLYVTQPLFVNSLTFSRIIGYYYIARAILASYLLFYLIKYNPNNKNKVIACIVLLLFLLHIFIQIYTDKGGHTDCIRYNFFWDYANTIQNNILM